MFVDIRLTIQQSLFRVTVLCREFVETRSIFKKITVAANLVLTGCVANEALLCHFFSSSGCRGFVAASACGSSWAFWFGLPFSFQNVRNRDNPDPEVVIDFENICVYAYL